MEINEIKLEDPIYDQQCSVCLSVGRKLLPPGQHTHIFMTITSNLRYPGNPLLCWECLALLRKVSKFQYNAWKANELLQLGQTCIDRSLSTLTTVIQNDGELYNVCMNETDIATDIPPDDIKYNDSDDNIENNDFIESHDLNVIKDENDLTKDCIENLIKIETEAKKESNKNKHRWVMTRKLENKKPKFKLITNYTMDDAFENIRISTDEVDTSAARERERKYKATKWKCDRCIKGFQTETTLLAHCKTYHINNKGPFICALCYKRVDDKRHLAAHVATHYYEFKCKLCDFSTRSATQQKNHFKIGHKYIFQCVKCEIIFGCRREFFIHFKKWHRNFTCHHCGLNFKMRYCIIEHIRTQHTPYKCEVCDKQYACAMRLRNHNRTVHAPVDAAAAVYCVECDRTYRDRIRYNDHLNNKTHKPHRVRRYPCPDCDKVFTKNIYMKEHRDMIHLKQFKYTCTTCDKNFLRKSALDKHKRRIHEGILPAKNKICYVCGRGFSTNKILNNHIRTHTGERPYPCPQCDARFTQKHALTAHVKAIHIPGRPLKNRK